jgi:hypothetical protein
MKSLKNLVQVKIAILAGTVSLITLSGALADGNMASLSVCQANNTPVDITNLPPSSFPLTTQHLTVNGVTVDLTLSGLLRKTEFDRIEADSNGNLTLMGTSLPASGILLGTASFATSPDSSGCYASTSVTLNANLDFSVKDASGTSIKICAIGQDLPGACTYAPLSKGSVTISGGGLDSSITYKTENGIF